MKRKAFTLVELLVVIAIIAMLLAILMPALNRVKQLAYRVVCGAHMRGIGQGIVVYAADFEDEYPIAGSQYTFWDDPANMGWDWGMMDGGPDPNGDNSDPETTISASLYLLVKYSEIPPDEFICKGGDEKKFELSKYMDDADVDAETIRDCFDFGPLDKTWEHVSYAYHYPYINADDKRRAASQMSPVSNAILADKNPWLDTRSDTSSPALVSNLSDEFDTYSADANNDPSFTKVTGQIGNSHNHAQEGQNVLFNDTHVRFEATANCGAENDNVYTNWGVPATLPVVKGVREAGASNPQPSDEDTFFPSSENDSVLLNDADPNFLEWTP